MPSYASWTTRAAMPDVRVYGGAVGISGKLYVFGGTPSGSSFDNSNALWCYDPAANSWTTLAPLPARLFNFAAYGVIDGKLYVAGGRNQSNQSQSTLWCYDPAADSWTGMASMPAPRNYGQSGSTVVNGKLYVVGALATTDAIARQTYVYDPVANSWATKALMPASRRQGAAGAIGNLLYIASGADSGGTARNSLYIYDTVADTWTTGATLPSAVTGLSGAVLNGQLVTYGQPGFYTNAMLYDPPTNAWSTTSVPALSEGRASPMAAGIGDRLYLAGGSVPFGAIASSLLSIDQASISTVARVGAPLRLSLAAPAGTDTTWRGEQTNGTPLALTLATPAADAPVLRGAAFTHGTAMALSLDTPPGSPRYPKPAQLEILDTALQRAPTAVVVLVTGVNAGAELTFDIDGVEALTAQADSAGTLSPISLAVDETNGAGTHTVTVTSGSWTQSATFTLQRDPTPILNVVGPDADPVYIAAALQETGVRKWVLQDLMPGGLGSYVMPISPSTDDAPLMRRTFQAHRTTSPDGTHHLYESGPEPLTWTLRGYCPNKAMGDQLLKYGALSRRFYVIDHRNRAWTALFTNVNLTPRKRQQEEGVFNDWAADYEITVLVYDEDWKAPQ